MIVIFYLINRIIFILTCILEIMEDFEDMIFVFRDILKVKVEIDRNFLIMFFNTDFVIKEIVFFGLFFRLDSMVII